MPNLAVDIGNSFIKIGSYENDTIIETKTYNSVNELVSNSNFVLKHEQLIYSSVTDQHNALVETFSGRMKIFDFNEIQNLPIKNLYLNPSSLGSDRLLAALGSYCLYPNTNVLSIDCGTCIKFNMVNAQAEFLGGSISPGMKMRYEALNHGTDKLPLIESNELKPEVIGNSTENSIRSGVVNGIIGEINYFMSEYKSSFDKLNIIVTGGDGAYFAKHLKSTIFVEPNLLLNGLNLALKYQLD